MSIPGFPAKPNNADTPNRKIESSAETTTTFTNNGHNPSEEARLNWCALCA